MVYKNDFWENKAYYIVLMNAEECRTLAATCMHNIYSMAHCVYYFTECTRNLKRKKG